MTWTPAEQDLIAFTGQHTEAMITFCQEMLRTPSVNGIHDEQAVAELIAAEASRLGLYVEVVGDDIARPNVVVRTAPDVRRGLLLVGHTDTVPPIDEDSWAYPPFSGTLADGRLYGRGAVDNKGGIAAALYALAALQTQDIPAALVCVPDEENGATGFLGIRWLHANDYLHGDAAIYTYSGRVIHIGHRGVVRYRLTCHGQSTHTGGDGWQYGEQGANAVTAMADLLLRMEAMSFAHSDKPYFDRFRTMVTPGTVIIGGSAVNIVPGECEALVDVRTTPEVDPEQLLLQVEALANAVEQKRKVTFIIQETNRLPAVMSPPETPIFTELQTVTEKLTGQRPPLAIAGPANEGYLLVKYGIPTVCGFGPIGAGFHATDEYVEVDSLPETAAIYALTGLRLAP